MNGITARRGSRTTPVAILAVLAAVATCCGGGKQDTRTYLRAGEEHFQAGDYDAAITAYEKVLELEPGSAVGYNFLGMAFRMKYNTVWASEWKEREIEAFRQAVAADSTFWPAHINLGATLYYMGNKEEAAPFFRRALELNPENPQREQLEAFIREGTG